MNLRTIHIEIEPNERILRLYVKNNDHELDTLAVALPNVAAYEFLETIDKAVRDIFKEQ